MKREDSQRKTKMKKLKQEEKQQFREDRKQEKKFKRKVLGIDNNKYSK
jgi:hypothetical protein